MTISIASRDVEVAPVAQQLGARVARHVLHDDEVLVVAGVEAEVEHLDDVGMDQPRSGQRLAPKARHERRVVGEVLGQQLDRHVALEPVVEREVDGRHPADPEAAFDPVPACDRRRAGHCPFLLAPPEPPLLLAPPDPWPVVNPAPPFEVVPVAGGLVAVLLDEVLVEVWVTGTVVVEVTVVVGVVGVEVEVLLEVVVEVEVEVLQSRAASWLTVSAPWPRFWINVVLTLRGRPPDQIREALGGRRGGAALPRGDRRGDRGQLRVEVAGLIAGQQAVAAAARDDECGREAEACGQECSSAKTHPAPDFRGCPACLKLGVAQGQILQMEL